MESHDALERRSVTTAPPSPLVSVVLSFRNEEENLPTLVARLDRMFASHSVGYELIFVNDLSTDESVDVLMGLRASNGRIKVINMSRRFGVAECVRAGMAASRGDAVVYMDTDLQDPPEVIPALLDAWRRGADIVHTQRTRRHGESPLKTWLTGIAYRILHVGATIDLPVEAGDFKLLSKRVVGHLLSLPEVDPYLRGLVVWVGFTQVVVPYEREGRHGGRTHFPFFSRNPWKTFLLGLTSFSFAPIYVVGVLAAVGLLAAATTFGVSIWMAAAGGQQPGLVALVALLTFFWATLLAAVAAVGLYVIRTYKDVRGRPQYIVASRVGFEETTQSNSDGPR